MSIKKQLMGIAAVLLVGALANSGILLYRLQQISSDGRVINYAGIVRGASQRLVKSELAGNPSDNLVTKIDKIIDGLRQGSDELALPKTDDLEFNSAMGDVDRSWRDLKQSLMDVRVDESQENAAFERSEEMFAKADVAVAAAQRVAEGKVKSTSYLQFVILLISLAIVAAIAFVTRRMTFTLHETVHALANTSGQMSKTVDMHQRIASDQATAMTETTITMEQLGASSRLSATQAETGADETSQSLALASDGATAVKQTVNAMADLKTKVTGMAQEIAALSNRLDQIGEISSFVGDIANQTNLLAMNAAVEAAHAGQHGKGFAVVATEIRKLADQSSKSVSRIHDLVADIRQATNATVMAADEGTKVVDQAMMLAEKTTKVFNNMEASVGRAADSVEQISLNNKEQAAGINQVVEAIDSLNKGAQQAADGLKDTGDGLQTLNEAVSHLQLMVGIDNAN